MTSFQDLRKEAGPCDYDPPESMIYLSGTITPGLRTEAHRDDLGVLAQPGTRRYVDEMFTFGLWGADNGCFAKGDKFDEAGWWSWIESVPRNDEVDRMHYTGRALGCLFVCAPDVVGDPVATWKRSEPWLARIMAQRLPAALVAQDGIEKSPIEWDAFDTLFIGGSTDWKMSQEALDLIAEAQAQGKWTHVGRVNSGRRFRHFADAPVPADSADGTFLAFGPEKNLPRLLSWLRPESDVSLLAA